MITVFTAPLVLPITAPGLLDGAIAVKDGRILHVGTRTWVLQSVRATEDEFVERHHRGIMTPGLVNAHTHLQYTHMAAVGRGEYQGFQSWSDAFDEVYDAGGHDWAAAAADGAQQSIRNGVTALADVVTDSPAATALHDAGLRGVSYWEVINWSNADWADHGAETVVGELDAVPTPPAVGLSPHSPYTLDSGPLLDIPDLVRRRGLRLHIHLGESEIEEGSDGVAEVLTDRWRLIHPESFMALREGGFGASATEFVDELGLLGPDCHIAHGVYMSAADRQLLRARNTSIALCPRSNKVIGLAQAPVAAYLREGSPIAVGTDSLSSSPSLDLLEDVRELAALATAQGYTEDDLATRLLSAATLGGARALGLDVGSARIGQLQVGALADIACFDIPVRGIAEGTESLVRGGAGSAVATIIAGEIVHGDQVLS